MCSRSTPCPNVKYGDEWCDPTQCENGDNCVYCHTRTEQQFHPEVGHTTCVVLSSLSCSEMYRCLCFCFFVQIHTRCHAFRGRSFSFYLKTGELTLCMFCITTYISTCDKGA